jgi:lysophospholipase L1-like esterase
MTPKNLVLAAATALLTLVVALLALRWLAPRLVGAPVEVRVVQSSERVPPFYEHVLGEAGRAEPLADPVTVTREAGLQRAQPGAGPTDVLGFRNPGVPNAADIITIGDSQTYGIGSTLAETWPQQLQARPEVVGEVVYNMSSVGWGPTQYVAMAQLAGKFRPRTVVVAYYTGNDAHDAFSQAHGNPLFARLRVNTNLRLTDQPRVFWPIRDGDRWEARFRDGFSTVFTPEYRLAANDRAQAGVREGYAIIAKTATVIAHAFEPPVQVWFTVIPTKELVYSARVHAEALYPSDDYAALVRDEALNLAELAASLRGMQRARYVDVLAPLQQAALAGARLYPSDTGGHPTAAGYAVIAGTIAAAVSPSAGGPPSPAAATR